MASLVAYGQDEINGNGLVAFCAEIDVMEWSPTKYPLTNLAMRPKPMLPTIGMEQ